MNDIVNKIFVYCVDFIINLANLLGISYYEVNAIIFCLVYPLLLIILIIIYIQKRQIIKKLK